MSNNYTKVVNFGKISHDKMKTDGVRFVGRGNLPRRDLVYHNCYNLFLKGIDNILFLKNEQQILLHITHLLV